MYNYMRKLKHD